MSLSKHILVKPSRRKTTCRVVGHIGGQIEKIQIIDLMGKTVFVNKNISVSLYKCNLNLFPDGMYMTESLVAGILYRNKIIISH